MKNQASTKDLFLIFLRAGAFTFGGGHAMIPLFRHEMTSRHWFSEDQFADILTLSQGAPGPIAVNLAIYTGLHLRGAKGAFAATLGIVLPSFLVILAIASIFPAIRSEPRVMAAFNGLRPAVVALISVAAFYVGRSSVRSIKTAIVSALALVGLVAGLHPIVVLLLTGVWALLSARREVKQ